MRTLLPALATLGLLAVVAGPARADKEINDCLKFVPSTANGIVIIDAESLYASPLGQKGGWKKKHQTDYLGGAVMFPSTATHVVFAAQLDQFGRDTTYQLGLAYLSKPVTMEALAKFEGGAIDTVSGTEVVRSPRNCYFVSFTPQVLGTYAPASRQEFSRWVKSGKSGKGGELSPFLQAAVAKAGWKNQIVLALDTTDMINPKMAKLHLAQLESLADKKNQLDGIAKLVSGMTGISVVVSVTNKLEGEIRVEFAESVRPYASFLKPVLLEVLAERGARIENLEAGEVTVGDNWLALKGPISEEALRKLMSIIQPPAAQTSPGDVAEGTPGMDPKVLASQRYYQSVVTLLNELKHQRVQKIQESGWWHQTYANKIDGLPILNVDPDLLAWGGRVSGMLRNIGASLQGVALKNNALDAYRQETVYAWGPSYGSSGSWYGGYGSYYQPGGVWYENNYQQIWAAGRENTTKGASDRVDVWKMIDQETADIRKKMTIKYNTEF